MGKNNTNKTTVKTTVAKVPQPHGGALNSGGTPGNKGGIGQPPSAIREHLRGSLADRVHIIEGFADNDELPTADRLRALDLMGKYGLGAATDLTVETVRERLRQTLEVLRRSLEPDQVAPIVAELHAIWTTNG